MVHRVMTGARQLSRIANRGAVGRAAIDRVGAEVAEQETTLDFRTDYIGEGAAGHPRGGLTERVRLTAIIVFVVGRQGFVVVSRVQRPAELELLQVVQAGGSMRHTFGL